MARNLTGSMITEVEKRLLRPMILAELYFTSGWLRLWTGYGSLTWDSKTWTGTGTLGSISQIKETAEVSAEPLVLALSGIPNSLISQCIDEIMQGAPALVYQGFLDESGGVIASPYAAWVGHMGGVTVDKNPETSTIAITVENKLVSLQIGPTVAQTKYIITAAMLTNSGMGSFSAANAVDDDITDVGWSTDSALSGSTVTIDLGSGQAGEFRRLRMYMSAADYAGSYEVEYSDNPTASPPVWTAAASGVIPDVAGWNDFELAPDGAHRYWRLRLTNAPGAGPEVREVQFHESDVDTDTLIAAANICDEDVELANTSPVISERRYTINGSFGMDEVPADVIPRMNSAMAGSVTFVGGKWGIYPAAWRAASLSLTDDDLAGGLSVQIKRPAREIFNSVKGLYISPTNDWQPSDFPPQSNATYVAQDQHKRIWRDAEYPFTTSAPTAQRISKIAIERNRRQIVVTAKFKLKAWQVQPMDVIEFTHAHFGWTNKTFEVAESKLEYEPGEGGALVPVMALVLIESDSAVYDWSTADENSIDDVPEPAIDAPRGVDFFYPSEHTLILSGNGFVDDPGDSYDKDDASYSLLGVDGNSGSNLATIRQVVIGSNQKTYTHVTVKVRREVSTATLNAGSGVWRIQVQDSVTNTVLTTVDIRDFNDPTTGIEVIEIPLSETVNLARISILPTALVGALASSGQLRVKVYEAWIEAQY